MRLLARHPSMAARTAAAGVLADLANVPSTRTAVADHEAQIAELALSDPLCSDALSKAR